MPAPISTEKPAVSVVLPVFNGAQTIVRAVQSILGQTLQDIELIVIDDGSSDDTVSRLQDLREPRLKVTSTPHGGVAAPASGGAAPTPATVFA